MDKPNETGSSCAWCPDPSYTTQGRIMLCVKHFRFSTMRTRAKRDGKAVPSYQQLDELLEKYGVECPVCTRTLNWLSKDGRSTVRVLQHDRDGGLKFLCLSCNTRHGARKGDSFYEIPTDSKMCPGCNTVKLLTEFVGDKYRWAGRKTYCRPCSAAKHAAWRNSL